MNAESMRFAKHLNRLLNNVVEVLPCEYNEKILLKYFKKLYPFEWKEIIQRYKVYQQKDDFFVKNGKKRRYKHLSPNEYFFTLAKVKHILSEGQKTKHKQNCNNDFQLKKFLELKKIREFKINNKLKKIKKYKTSLQKIDPMFIDILINFYHKRGNSINEKMEIVKEMQKYDSKKVIEFFYKLNDAEKNSQIRRIAFKHLQNLGYYVKLRKNFKGKKKSYMLEKTQFIVTPKDLFERLKNRTTIQHKKKYDFFISHSYLDYDLVIGIMKKLNKLGYLVYCDWSSDNDFLKRNLANEYKDFVLYVLQKRIEQSKKVLFILTEHSKNQSSWIKQELNHAKKFGKEILCLNFLKKECELKSLNITLRKIVSGE